jgi:hypothetical protein
MLAAPSREQLGDERMPNWAQERKRFFGSENRFSPL